MSSKPGQIKVDGEIMNKRALSGYNKHVVRGHSEPGMGALEAEYRRRKARADIMAQHGKVRIIVKDGKPVEEK